MLLDDKDDGAIVMGREDVGSRHKELARGGIVALEGVEKSVCVHPYLEFHHSRSFAIATSRSSGPSSRRSSLR